MELNTCVVGGHTLFREGLVALLVKDGRLGAVSQSADLRGAVAVGAESRPAVFMVDVDAGGGSPSTTVSTLARSAPESRVIALSGDVDDVFRGHLVGSGASTVLSKEIAVAQLVDLSLAALLNRCDSPGVVRAAGRRLTARESDVLRLVARAESNRDIARALEIAEGTVKRHLNNIFDKLGATSRWDALRRARRLGELPENDGGSLLAMSREPIRRGDRI